MPSFNLNPEHIMKDVYSYPFPEVRELLRQPAVDPDFMLNTIDGERAQTLLSGYGFEPTLELPTRRDGTLDLDELHLPIIDRLRNRVREQLPGVSGFEYAYPTPGSSQAMFTLMAEWHAQGNMKKLAVLEGDYDGYTAYAKSLNIPIERYQSLTEAPVEDETVWFISNPTAIDGNWLDSQEFTDFIAKGHETVIDAAYIGLTQDGAIDVSAPNIRAVLTSPSKIFGVFRYRNTGIAYTREPVAALHGSKWFKDIPALLDTLRLYESFEAHELAAKYAPVQRLLSQHLSELVEADVRPSDVLLLANTTDQVRPEYQTFQRRNNYRFGLTKLFEDYEVWQKGEK